MSAEKKPQTSNIWFDSKAVVSRLAYIAEHPYGSLLSPRTSMNTLAFLTFNLASAIADEIRYITDGYTTFEYRTGTSPGLSPYVNIGNAAGDCGAVDVPSNTTSYGNLIERIEVPVNSAAGLGSGTIKVLCEQLAGPTDAINTTANSTVINCMKSKMSNDCSLPSSSTGDQLTILAVLAGPVLLLLLGCVAYCYRDKIKSTCQDMAKPPKEETPLHNISDDNYGGRQIAQNF